MAKWVVRKRDGVWVVLDGARKLRYASSEHRMALSFALMRGQKTVIRPITLADIRTWRDAIQKAIDDQWRDDDDK